MSRGGQRGQEPWEQSEAGGANTDEHHLGSTAAAYVLVSVYFINKCLKHYLVLHLLLPYG